MKEQESMILSRAFSTEDGKAALEIIRDMSGYDKRTFFCGDERNSCFNQGKAALFHDIVEGMNTTKIRKDNGRRRNRKSEFGE